MTTFHSFTVASVKTETRDAVTIAFTIPDAPRNNYAFRPDQHLTLKAHLGEEGLRRCYSICRSHSPSEISIVVKAIDDGRFPRYVRQGVQQGMALEMVVPQRHFGYQPQAEREAEYLAIAVGSGITPMVAIIEVTLTTEPASQFTLIYGDRSSHSMVFRQASVGLKDRHPQRLQAVHLFDQGSMDSNLLRGRIDGDKLRALGKDLPDSSHFNDAFICGPSAVMGEAEVTPHELGIMGRSIHPERFNTPGIGMERTTSVRAEGRTVTLHQNGRDRLISPNAEDNGILDTALRQGADLSFTRRGGVCTACKCEMISDGVAMAANYNLETDELATGYVLNCQALPTSGGVVVDFDAWGVV